MRRGPDVWTRAGRLGGALERRALRREAARVAAEVGVSADELVAEAEALLGRARAAEARTAAEVDAFCAGELGIEPAAWAAELADVRNRCAR